MKVVINTIFGGFGLSDVAIDRMSEIVGRKVDADDYYSDDSMRTAPELIQVVEELDKESWGHFANLKIVEIPDDVDWFISEYDGMEQVEEKHRIWC